jgi:hypothetical protein
LQAKSVRISSIKLRLKTNQPKSKFFVTTE